jgi:cell division protein FtsL
MNRLGFALAMFAVVASAAWAYHINYRTKTALARVDALREQISAEREALEVLRVEWAYLNAPDRLADLVRRQNKMLGLVPLSPANFDEVASIPYPAVDESDLPAGTQDDGVAPAAAAVLQPMLLVAGPQLAAAQSAPVPAPRPQP